MQNDDLQVVDVPTKWPGANARLLGVGFVHGLPVKPLDRLGLFSPDEFERFVLEWAHGYLNGKLAGVNDVQQRGGAGDKGRDIVVWFGAPGSPDRFWHLYQCKRYNAKIGVRVGLAEIGKVLYFASIGKFSMPKEYWFVTHRGVTNDFQDLIDYPDDLKFELTQNWDKYCSTEIIGKKVIKLEDKLLTFVEGVDLSLVRVKQPLDILAEHAETTFHRIVFGKPLIDREKAPPPPSTVAEEERGYVQQLYEVISEMISAPVTKEADFATHRKSASLFERSRITFYSAEGLKRLAHDQMQQVEFFHDLVTKFGDGLYHTYNGAAASGHERLTATVKAAQQQEIDAHALKDHMEPLDREGICHHLANDGIAKWCRND
ncbi:hypothetical protein ASG25_09255 [Rhizobium sp. Leaf384]|uniref:ABC-three component system protein n=1 Tax=Rhizobium sp. Leaf384 TaxID=1736358 RepID=UPI000713BEEC|nr:ABC-three component system protein [Rhizobium sp. Leaf384]KQS79522.1 hypothetical protein ASG25_09255 [Rhizobium sp. Leaf384]